MNGLLGSSPSRRRLMSALAGIGTIAAAGCLETGGADDEDGDEAGDDGSTTDPDESDFLDAFPEVDDPPEAVYRPTHREVMRMGEPVSAGDLRLAPMYTYPHPFWVVTGQTAEYAPPGPEEDVHLMVTAWDDETGTVVPLDTGVDFVITKDGEAVSERTAWLMISQQMGFHFGDNVELDGDGTYRVEGTIDPPSASLTGAFEGRFEESTDFEFEFTFDDDLRTIVDEIEYFDEEEWGEPGALEPMDHDDHSVDGDDNGHDDHDDDNGHDDHGDDGHDDHGDDEHVPYSSLPPAEELPGIVQEPVESGDAVFAVTILEQGSRFVDDDEWYLAVSPRTPYNRCVLPLMSMQASVDSSEWDLRETLDDELEYHYGAAVDTLEDGDELTVEISTSPQVSRHQGYETAFIEMPDLSLTLSL